MYTPKNISACTIVVTDLVVSERCLVALITATIFITGAYSQLTAEDKKASMFSSHVI